MRRENKVFGRRERGARKRIWGEGMRCKNKVFGGRERGARKKNSGVGNEEQKTSIWGERMGRKKSIWGKGMRHEKKILGGRERDHKPNDTTKKCAEQQSKNQKHTLKRVSSETNNTHTPTQKKHIVPITRGHQTFQAHTQNGAKVCLPWGGSLAFSQNSKSRETVGQNLSNWSIEPIKKRSGFISVKLNQ